jgi:putative transposase
MANQAFFPVRTMCRVFGVSASGFYAWGDRPPSAREIQNRVLTERIRDVHEVSDRTYGRPRIHAELADGGWCVGQNRIATLMRKASIRGVSRRRGFVVTTQRDRMETLAPDLVKRQFVATAPNQLWSRI